jgi:hypothetical protein
VTRPVPCDGLRHCPQSNRRFQVHVRARTAGAGQAAVVEILVVPGFPAVIETWEPPVVPCSAHGNQRR